MLVDISNHLDIFVYSTLSYELNISYCRPLRTTAWSNATVSRPPPAWKTIRYVELFTGCPGFISWVKHKWNCENIYIKKNLDCPLYMYNGGLSPLISVRIENPCG